MPPSGRAASAGSPAPPSNGGDAHAAGDPAATHLENKAISAAVARAAGDGGMGLTGSCTRARATWATVLDGSLRAGAVTSAYVTSGIGAPATGGLAWHVTHRARKMGCTSQYPTKLPASTVPPMLEPPAPVAPPAPGGVAPPASGAMLPVVVLVAPLAPVIPAAAPPPAIPPGGPTEAPPCPLVEGPPPPGHASLISPTQPNAVTHISAGSALALSRGAI